MRMIVASLLVGVVVGNLAAQQRAEPATRLVVDTGKATYLIKPDGQLDKGTPGGEHELWAPDRQHKVVFHFTEQRGYVFSVADAAGKTVAKLSEASGFWPPMQLPSWSPDGKRLAFSTRAGQIAVLELPGGKLTTVTKEDRGATDPQFLPDGRIAYLAQREPESAKSHFSDIMVTDGMKSEVVVKHVVIYDFALSPNGTKVAYDNTHNGGTLAVLDLKTGKTTKLAVGGAMGPKLYAHGARSIRWRPDGQAIACMFTFLGGRLHVGDGPVEPMAGDREVFFLPLDGKPTYWTASDGDPRLLYWR